MSNMIERVARALYAEEVGTTEGWDGPLMADRGRNMWRKKARAAIEAMREPTEAMCESGSAVTWWDGKDDEEWEENVSTSTAKDIYQAMIDAALK